MIADLKVTELKATVTGDVNHFRIQLAALQAGLGSCPVGPEDNRGFGRSAAPEVKPAGKDIARLEQDNFTRLEPDVAQPLQGLPGCFR